MPSLTGYKIDQVGTYIDKDPYAVLDYTLDFTNWMPTGDTISTITVTAETISGDSAPLTHPNGHGTDVQATTTKVTFRVSGGTAGNVYPIEVKIATSAGDIDSRHFRIICKDKGLE